MKIKIREIYDVAVPALPGIYFIFQEEIVIYIGTGISLVNRLDPSRLFKSFVSRGATHIQWFEINYNRLELEKQLIKMFEPILNINYSIKNGQLRTEKFARKSREFYELSRKSLPLPIINR